MLYIHNNYTNINLDDLSKFYYPISSRASMLIIQRKVHFLYAKNLPAKLPGYTLDIVYMQTSPAHVHRVTATHFHSEIGQCHSEVCMQSSHNRGTECA